MKRMTMFTLAVAVAIAFAGCKKKEPTPGAQLDSAIKQAQQTSQDASKDADKTATDLQKKLDNALKK